LHFHVPQLLSCSWWDNFFFSTKTKPIDTDATLRCNLEKSPGNAFPSARFLLVDSEFSEVDATPFFVSILVNAQRTLQEDIRNLYNGTLFGVQVLQCKYLQVRSLLFLRTIVLVNSLRHTGK